MSEPGEDFEPYLCRDDIIDWDSADVFRTAKNLAEGKASDVEIARACFSFVRDEIAHSVDARRGPVTCRASDVLRHGTGYCYAKSHLLAALLRANGIPAALCYQRLSIEGGGAPYSLHGLNAVWLAGVGWYRLDARGNKAGVDAQFDPPHEQLAFAALDPGEHDVAGRFASPLPEVVAALDPARTWEEVLANLPDVGA